MQQHSRSLALLLVGSGDVASAGLMTLLATDRRFTVVITSAAEAIADAQRLQPHMIVVDPQREGSLEMAIVSALTAAAPNACICLYTASADPHALATALNRGVRGYLVKGSDSHLGGGAGALLLDALALLGRSGFAIVDGVVVRPFVADRTATLTVVEPPSAGGLLSPRERQVLPLMAEGLTDTAIAARFGVRPTTVGKYVTRLYQKLGAVSRAHLVALAIHRGLLDP
jgi:DNA-binding NarL/FixJ family response regulator